MTTEAIQTQGTIINIGGGDDTPINISTSYPAIIPGAITKVTTAAAHGLSVGDVGKFASVGGMTEINGLTGVVVAVESTTVFWVDINSVGFTAHASAAGTFTPEEWVPVGESVDFDGPGGAASVIDATHLGSTAREKIMGIPDEGQFTISLNRVFGNAGQKAVLLARAQRARKPFKIVYYDNSTQTFDGFVLQFSTSGGVDDKLNGSIAIEITGAVTTVAYND
jgi:hypothetical protein